MRPILIAMAVGLFATTAHAATPADGQPIVTCSALGGESNECAFDLVKGKDYALVGGEDDRSGTGELINPTGAVTITVAGGGGQEFRAAYSATYRLRVTSTGYDGFFARLATDCRADVKTLCTIAPGQAKTVDSLFRHDEDWLRLAARRGQVYTFNVVGTGYTEARVYDQSGRRVAAAHSSRISSTVTIGYRARYAGAYYVSASSSGQSTVDVR